MSMRGHTPSAPIVGARVRQLSTGREGGIPHPTDPHGWTDFGKFDVLFDGATEPERLPDHDLEVTAPSPLAGRR